MVQKFMFRKAFILSVLVGLASSNAFAWSWKDAVNQALEKNPGLNAQEAATDQIRLRYENAKSLRYPVFSLTGAYQQFQDESKDLEYRAYFGPRVQLLLFKGGKVTAGIKQASALDRQAQLTLQVTSMALNLKLRQAFATALYAKHYLDLSHRIEARRRENVKFTEIRYQSGLEYKWVFLTSSAKWRQAELDVIRSEMNKKTTLADLENILGALPVQSVEEIGEDDFFAVDPEYVLDDVLKTAENNPKMLIEKTRVEEARAGVDFNRADYYPQLALQGDAWAMSTETNNLFPFWLATASVNMPLFEGGRIRRNVRIAEKQLLQRSFGAQQTELDIKADLQKTYQSYYIARKQVEIGKLNVEASKDRAKVVSNQYRSGLASFLEWESSQDVWVSAEVDLLESIRAYHLWRARLEEAMGLGLKETL